MGSWRSLAVQVRCSRGSPTKKIGRFEHAPTCGSSPEQRLAGALITVLATMAGRNLQPVINVQLASNFIILGTLADAAQVLSIISRHRRTVLLFQTVRLESVPHPGSKLARCWSAAGGRRSVCARSPIVLFRRARARTLLFGGRCHA